MSVKFSKYVCYGSRDIGINVRILASTLHCTSERGELIANSFALEGEEIATVVGGVLVAKLKIAGLPPRGRHVCVSLRSRYHKLPF